MPFAQRIVEPAKYEIVPGSLKTDDPELIPVEISNRIIVTILEQMKCLVRHADDIFCDLTEECHKVVERTDKVKEKVKSLTEAVDNLNYRTVPIPVGDLKVFCQKENGIDHFEAKHGYDCFLLATDTRPQCLKDLHNMAMVNPLQIIRRCDEYRRDGVKGSMLFKQWPVFDTKSKSKTPELSLRKLPPVVTFEKDYKPLKLRNIMVKRADSSEKDEEAIKPDTAVIPIDTSGVTFQRMCSFRQSLRSVDGDETLTRDVKKKRRQTVSGVPDNVWREIRAFESRKTEENKRNSIQDRLKSYSFDDLDAELSANDGELIKYLNQVEDRIEEREEHENSLAENKFLRLIPCRRSCSLPRSAKLQAARQKQLSSRPLSKCQAKSETTLANLISNTGALSNKRSSSIGSTLSLQSAGSVASSRQSRSTKRSSFIGVKIKSLLNVGSKSVKDSSSRPKSLDIDALEVEPELASTSSNLSRAPSMPEGIHNKVGPGSFYYFDNNTLPKMLAKKYDFPWESLPKDWTTSVKLREISKRRTREDRNSSSGNWSGSSARQSMESERAKSISALSHRSLGTDSGRESPTPTTADGTTTDTAAEAGDEGSLTTGDADRTVFEKKTRASRLDTEAWLRNLSIRAAARADSSSSSETINSATKMDVPPMEDFTGDILERYRLMDDDASSVYSLDQEGFYTSFHNDSGLRRSTTTLWEEEAATSPVDGKANSIQSVSSNLSVDSVIQNPLLKTVPSPVIMRPPPKRRTSSGAESDGSAIFSLPAPTPQPSLNPTVDFSFSESDQEIIYARVKQKTRISTTMYPSLCDVSTSDSEEEGLQGKLNGRTKVKKHKPMFDPESVKVVELSPVFESSFGAGKVNMLGNDFDFEDDSTSRVLSTFSTGSDDSLENKKTIAEIPTKKTLNQRTKTIDSDDSKKYSFQNFSSISSLERKSSKSSSYQPNLKPSSSLDDSNLLGSSSEDTAAKKQLFNSLPRHYHIYKRQSVGQEHMNSWPRSHPSPSNVLTVAQPASGILKSTQKTSSFPKAPKTLNFAPVVNMFDPGTPESVQVFPTSSGESPVREVSQYKLPQTNSFTVPDDVKPLKVEKQRPLSSGSESDFTQEIDLPAKYMPTLVVRPGKRPSSSGSDVSPYATSSLTRNVKKSTASSVSSSDPADLGVYRKTLINSPTVDSGIGSVGDLSPSTPTSSVGADEDLEQKDLNRRPSIPSPDSVFPVPSVEHRILQSKYSFLNVNSTENLEIPHEQKISGADLVENGVGLDFADEGTDTQRTPTRQAPQQPVSTTYSNTFPNVNGIYRPSQSDSKLVTHSNKEKSTVPTRNSFSSFPSSGLVRTESPQNKGPTNARVSPNSTRTSSYRNACVNSTRSPSYRVAQSNIQFGSKLDNGKQIPAPTFRSDSYRVACDDLVPPPVPEHKGRTETLKSLQVSDSASRAESYRVAIEEMEDPEIFEYKPVNKRAAITSLDQLLPKPAVNGSSKGLKSPKQIKRSFTESGLFARLRGKQDKSSSKMGSSKTPGPVKSSYVPLGLPNGQDSSKAKSATSYRVKPKSSTYMSFDILSSVEEVREDSVHGSMESVKSPSVSSIQSFQSGQSTNSFLRREDHHPLVRQSNHHMLGKSKSQIILPSSDSRRRSTGSTSSTRVMGGPHITNSYKTLLLDSSMETGV